MKKRMKQFLKNLILLMASFLAGIETCQAEDVNLEKIVITSSIIEQDYGNNSRNIDVVTGKDMETSGSENIAEALTNITSVNIKDYGGSGGSKAITMRGATASQVLVSVDGRPVNNPRDGQVDLNSIFLDNIERIEVVHGPGSSLYGSQAMGGMVNIITKRPPKKGQKTEASTSFGTFRTYTEKLLQGARIGKFGYLITGGFKSSEGFRTNSEFNSKDANVKLEYEINGNNNLMLNSGFYTSKAGTPGTITSPDIDDKQKDLQNYFDFNWNFKPDIQTALSAKVYQNYDRLEFMENSTTYTKDIHTTTVRGLDLQLDKQLLDTYGIVCGFNYVKNMNDSTTSAKHRYNVTSGYLENRLNLFDKKLNINLSARLDDYSNFGTKINPSLDLLYKLDDTIKFHGLISRSYRVPTFNDLYNSIPGMGVSNPNLVPEKGITGEFGVESRVNKYLSTSLTYYRSNYKQLIQWSKSVPEWQVMNVSSAVINGIEFENKIFISDNLDLNIGYTFLSAKDENTHKYLVYQPEHKIDSSIKYNNHNGLTVELKSQFTGTRFGDANNANKVKSFFVLGFSVSKKFKSGLTCFTYIDNLLNRKYQIIQGYPMPGFSITGGLKIEL